MAPNMMPYRIAADPSDAAEASPAVQAVPRTWYDDLKDAPDGVFVRTTWAEWRQAGFLNPKRACARTIFDFLGPEKEQYRTGQEFVTDYDRWARGYDLASTTYFVLESYEVLEGIGLVVTYRYAWNSKRVVVGPS